MRPIRATYLLRCDRARVRERAAALALEQTAELPEEAVRRSGVAERTLGRVVSIEEAGPSRSSVTIEYPAATQDGSLSQLLNVLFGNCSLQDDVELTGIDLPPGMAGRFGGPRAGAAGLRALTGTGGRPLTATALKPVGLDAGALADLCTVFARAGIDVIKDDHGLADQPSAPFAERVAACQRAVRAAGGSSLYVPHVSGSPARIARQIAVARDEGVRAVMVAPMLCGLPAFQELATSAGVALIAHPALGGAARIAPPVLLGRLFRLAGADAAIFPHAGGRFGYSEATCAAIADALRDDWCGLLPALPMPAGGMALDRVTELLSFYGPDVILLIGGGLYVDRDAIGERAARFVAAVRGAASSR